MPGDAWSDGAVAGLLRNRTVRQYLGQYSQQSWPDVLKLTLLYGVLGLQRRFPGRALSVAELKELLSATQQVTVFESVLPNVKDQLAQLAVQLADVQDDVVDAPEVRLARPAVASGKAPIAREAAVVHDAQTVRDNLAWPDQRRHSPLKAPLPAAAHPRRHSGPTYAALPSSDWRDGEASGFDGPPLSPHGSPPHPRARSVSPARVHPLWWGDGSDAPPPSPPLPAPRLPLRKPPRLAYSLYKEPPALYEDDLVTARYLNVPSSGYGQTRPEHHSTDVPNKAAPSLPEAPPLKPAVWSGQPRSQAKQHPSDPSAGQDRLLTGQGSLRAGRDPQDEDPPSAWPRPALKPRTAVPSPSASPRRSQSALGGTGDRSALGGTQDGGTIPSPTPRVSFAPTLRDLPKVALEGPASTTAPSVTTALTARVATTQSSPRSHNVRHPDGSTAAVSTAAHQHSQHPTRHGSSNRRAATASTTHDLAVEIIRRAADRHRPAVQPAYQLSHLLQHKPWSPPKPFTAAPSPPRKAVSPPPFALDPPDAARHTDALGMDHLGKPRREAQTTHFVSQWAEQDAPAAGVRTSAAEPWHGLFADPIPADPYVPQPRAAGRQYVVPPSAAPTAAQRTAALHTDSVSTHDLTRPAWMSRPVDGADHPPGGQLFSNSHDAHRALPPHRDERQYSQPDLPAVRVPQPAAVPARPQQPQDHQQPPVVTNRPLTQPPSHSHHTDTAATAPMSVMDASSPPAQHSSPLLSFFAPQNQPDRTVFFTYPVQSAYPTASSAPLVPHASSVPPILQQQQQPPQQQQAHQQQRNQEHTPPPPPLPLPPHQQARQQQPAPQHQAFILQGGRGVVHTQGQQQGRHTQQMAHMPHAAWPPQPPLPPAAPQQQQQQHSMTAPQPHQPQQQRVSGAPLLSAPLLVPPGYTLQALPPPPPPTQLSPQMQAPQQGPHVQRSPELPLQPSALVYMTAAPPGYMLVPLAAPPQVPPGQAPSTGLLKGKLEGRKAGGSKAEVKQPAAERQQEGQQRSDKRDARVAVQWGQPSPPQQKKMKGLLRARRARRPGRALGANAASPEVPRKFRPHLVESKIKGFLAAARQQARHRTDERDVAVQLVLADDDQHRRRQYEQQQRGELQVQHGAAQHGRNRADEVWHDQAPTHDGSATPTHHRSGSMQHDPVTAAAPPPPPPPPQPSTTQHPGNLSPAQIADSVARNTSWASWFLADAAAGGAVSGATAAADSVPPMCRQPLTMPPHVARYTTDTPSDGGGQYDFSPADGGTMRRGGGTPPSVGASGSLGSWWDDFPSTPGADVARSHSVPSGGRSFPAPSFAAAPARGMSAGAGGATAVALPPVSLPGGGSYSSHAAAGAGQEGATAGVVPVSAPAPWSTGVTDHGGSSAARTHPVSQAALREVTKTWVGNFGHLGAPAPRSSASRPAEPQRGAAPASLAVDHRGDGEMQPVKVRSLDIAAEKLRAEERKQMLRELEMPPQAGHISAVTSAAVPGTASAQQHPGSQRASRGPVTAPAARDELVPLPSQPIESHRDALHDRHEDLQTAQQRPSTRDAPHNSNEGSQTAQQRRTASGTNVATAVASGVPPGGLSPLSSDGWEPSSRGLSGYAGGQRTLPGSSSSTTFQTHGSSSAAPDSWLGSTSLSSFAPHKTSSLSTVAARHAAWHDLVPPQHEADGCSSSSTTLSDLDEVQLGLADGAEEDWEDEVGGLVGQRLPGGRSCSLSPSGSGGAEPSLVRTLADLAESYR